MGNDASKNMQDKIFDMRFQSKQLEKQANKALSRSKKEAKKIKKAMQEGNLDIARLYAENAIRHKVRKHLVTNHMKFPRLHIYIYI